jgi:hypothetical protein
MARAKLTTQQARAMAAARKTIGKSTGRPKGAISRKKRCPCGEMTARRAKARCHHC